MKTIAKKQMQSWKQQRGMTLIELLVAGIISLIAATGMIVVMANTLGTSSHTIQMARVTEEMRTAMQIMSRELRRANFHSTYLTCFNNPGCLGTGSLGIDSKVKEISITDNGDSDCFWFWYDRPQSGSAVAVTSEPVAAFRLTTIVTATETIGKLQMTTTRTTTPGCNLDADWVDITDPDIIDIETFNVDDDDSFVETINAGGDTQNVERIALSITAKLPVDPSLPTWFQSNANASRELREFVTVRNNITTDNSP